MGYATLGYAGGPNIAFRQGSLTCMTETVQKTCSVSDCPRVSYCKTFCGMHYRRWLRHGDPLITKKVDKYTEPCAVDGCTEKVEARALCLNHYQRMRKYGDPVAPPQYVQGVDHHWWGGDSIGYVGQHGRVRRKYGTPKCCAHCGLEDPDRWYDWAYDNIGDRNDPDNYIRLCRPCHRTYDTELMARGSRHGMSKLSEQSAREIRQRRGNGELLRILAEEYGVSITTIFDVASGKTWRS